MGKLFFASLLVASLNSFGQSPTFQALVNLSHDVDNSRFDLNAAPKRIAFKNKESLWWANVYFRYFKNPNTRPSQKHDESMKFQIRYQFLLDLYIEQDTVFVITIPKGPKDKLIDVKSTVFRLEDEHMSSEKIKPKNFSTIKEDNKVQFTLRPGIVKAGEMLRILVETESYNFNHLGPFYFSPSVPGKFELILTANIPEMFSYTFPDNIKLQSRTVNPMQLKEFTYRSPPIVNYNASSHSFKWTIPPDQAKSGITFPLDRIELPRDFGTSVDRMMRTSK